MINMVRALIPKKLLSPMRHIYSYVPLEKRMGKEYWQLKAFLQEAQWWDREKIEAWQLGRLKETVHHAYENVPGYYALYREAGIKPNDLNTLADTKNLPFITKELIRDNLDDFTARDIPSWKRIYVTSGGSTGTPFGFYHTATNIWMENAFMHSGWEWTGWELGDESAVLRGSSFGSERNFWKYNSATRVLLLSSYYLTDSTFPEYIKKLEEFSPRHIQAYPSTVTLLADYIIESDAVGRVDFDTILLGSENIYEWQKDKLSRAFPSAKIFGWYGHTEQAILAPMCESSNQYHSWPFYGLIEVVNEQGGSTAEGGIGELVGTSFWNYGTPFIRYKTMDIGRKGKLGCNKCGRHFQLIENIEGRMQDYVVTSDGGLVTLTALIFAQHFHAFGAIKNMQLYQDQKGIVAVRVIPKATFTEQDADEIKDKMERAVGNRITVWVDLLEDIPRTLSGKYRFLEQKLDIKFEVFDQG